MKKIIIFIVAACLPLAATAGGRFKVNPARIQAIVDRIGLPTLEESIQRDLASLQSLEWYQRDLDNFPTLLSNLALLGYTSPKYIPEIEKTYALFKDQPDGEFLSTLLARACLRHGEYDPLVQFQNKYGSNGDFWQSINDIMEDYGALTMSQTPLRVTHRPSIQEENRSIAQNSLSGKESTAGPLGVTLDKFGKKFTLAWLPEKGTAADLALRRLASQQKENPSYYINRTTKMLSEVQEITQQLEKYKLEYPSTQDSQGDPSEDILQYFIYRDADLPPIHKLTIVRTFLERYDFIVNNSISQLKFFADSLQKYLDNPRMFSHEEMNEVATRLRTQAYATRADLVAFIQYNMTGGTPLQHKLYDALSHLADYYRFLQRNDGWTRQKIQIPQEWQDRYGLSGVFSPGSIGRVPRSDNWAEPFLIDDDPSGFEVYQRGVLEEQVRKYATRLTKEINKSTLPLSNVGNTISQQNFTRQIKIPLPSSESHLWMTDPSREEQAVMKERVYIGYISAAAYMRELLLQDMALIKLEAAGTEPLPNQAFARQRYANVNRAARWLHEIIDTYIMDAGSLRAIRREVVDPSPIVQVSYYWESVIAYERPLDQPL
ncbi:MAG: hypothetical protein J5601_06245 [Elusimicrobiaceae bacterium]|nr:hypothetical protein [Elusimicrobiaceae bacterium]